MERAFIVSEESKYSKDIDKYYEMGEHQRKFVNEFLKEKAIEAVEYRVGGDGIVNAPFDEYDKNNIKLYIIPTESDLDVFGKMMCKPDMHGIRSFKKSSKISKEFAQRCIDNQIVVNLCGPRAGEYFKSIGFYGCSYSQFLYNNKLYLKMKSDFLKVDDTPEGFTEIRLSEFYKALEEYNGNKCKEC